MPGSIDKLVSPRLSKPWLMLSNVRKGARLAIVLDVRHIGRDMVSARYARALVVQTRQTAPTLCFIVAPAEALGHAHISETPSLCQEAKLVDADFESDGAGRSRGWVSSQPPRRAISHAAQARLCRG